MADYYPLLAKALANLPSRSAPTARRAIYERARKALIGQLRSIQPPMAESDIANEDAALDQAIARLEAEYLAQPPAASASKPPPAPPPTIPRPNPPAAGARTPPPGAPPNLAPASDSAASTKTASAPAPFAASAAATLVSPPPARPLTAAPNTLQKPPLSPPTLRRPSLNPSALAEAPPTAPSVESVDPGAVRSSSAPPIGALRASGDDDHGLAPAVAPSQPSSLTIPPALRGSADTARPMAPGRTPAPRRNPWPLIALAVLAGAAGTIAVAAYLWRDAPQDIVPKATNEASDKPGLAGQNKIAERVEAGGPSDPPPAPPPTPAPAPATTSATQPAAGETPIPTVPVAPVPVVPAHPADTVQTAAGAPAAPAPANLPASSIAAILIGVTSDPQKPAVTMGNAIWSVVPPTSASQPSTLAVRIEVDIPDQKMHATVTIRKNADASLPATHTIDLRATFADGAEIKGIKDMGLPQLRKQDAPAGDAVSGVRVKINDSYYLVGLTRSDADAAHNLDLLSTSAWLDFPLLLNDDRIAKLTMEKGASGDQVMAQALNAWK